MWGVDGLLELREGVSSGMGSARQPTDVTSVIALLSDEEEGLLNVRALCYFACTL